MTITYNQVSVATTGTTAIVPALNSTLTFSAENSRRSVTITNRTSNPVYLGGDTSLTSSNGYLLAASTQVTFVLLSQDAIYGVATGGASTVSFITSDA